MLFEKCFDGSKNSKALSFKPATMYTSIEHKWGLEALKHLLNARAESEMPPTYLSLSLTGWTLTNNVFFRIKGLKRSNAVLWKLVIVLLMLFYTLVKWKKTLCKSWKKFFSQAHYLAGKKHDVCLFVCLGLGQRQSCRLFMVFWTMLRQHQAVARI